MSLPCNVLQDAVTSNKVLQLKRVRTLRHCMVCTHAYACARWAHATCLSAEKLTRSLDKAASKDDRTICKRPPLIQNYSGECGLGAEE